MRNKFLRNPLHIVKDYELRKLLWQSGGGTAVCKKYLKFRDIAPEKLTFPETKVDEPIWLFWNTGLLNDQNLADYIRLPDYIEKKKDTFI